MAYSWEEHLYPAGTTSISVNIQYLDRSYIYLYVDNEEVLDFTWESDVRIRLDAALTKESKVLIVRRTAAHYLYINFKSGAPFISENLDTQNTQFLHLAQEMTEGRSIDGFYGDINMNGFRIINLAAGQEATDAVNKSQLDEVNSKVEALEGTFINQTSSYPWYTVVNTETSVLVPGLQFTKAAVYINGVCQTPGYSYEVVNNTIVLADAIPAGTHVFVRLGEDIQNSDGYASAANLAALNTALTNLDGPTVNKEYYLPHWRDSFDIRGWGVVGDGVTDDTSALSIMLKAAPATQVIDGKGKTFKVSQLPDIKRFRNAAFKYERVSGQPLNYVSEGYFEASLTKVTDTPFYNAWAQDKSFVYEDVIYAPFMAGERHGVQNLHVAWVRSGDDGQTWTMPEWLTPISPQYPNGINYHCFSMGVVHNRLYMVVESRTLAESRLVSTELWSRPMPYARRLTGGISAIAGNSYATVTVPNHSLKVGDAVNFSGSGVTGVSGNTTVRSVVDADRFTVALAAPAASDMNNSTTTWSFGTRFWECPWETTLLPDIAYSTNADLAVTETHSFTALSGNSAAVGYHNGDVAPRRLGVLYFPDIYNSPGTFERRMVLQEYADNASEPCIKYYDGTLYLTTRGTSTSQAGSTLARSQDNGVTWQYLRFPHRVHHGNLPFAKVGDELYIFGSERAQDEWEGGAPDNRYNANYARTFMCKVNVREWPSTLDGVEWFNISDQIYQGNIVNSAVGVGSVCVKDGWLYYIFGGEDFLSPWTIGGNSAKLWYVQDGHPPDLYSYRIKIEPQSFVSRDFKYGATPNRTLPVSMGTDGIRHVSAPMTFDEAVKTRSLQVTGVGHTGVQGAAASILLDGDYGQIYKSVPTLNPSQQRLILSGGAGSSASTGALIQLYGSNHSTPNRAILYASGGVYTQNDLMPFRDSTISLGSAGNRWSTVYATTGTINTSDGTLKTEPLEVEDALLDAWADVQVVSFKWLESVASKGDAARTHFGVIAQQVKDVLIKHGLMEEGATSCKYAFLCYDEYPEMLEYDEEGNPVVVAEAGHRWGIRSDQMFFIEMLYQRRELKKLQDAVALLLTSKE